MQNAIKKFVEIERHLNQSEATTLSFDNSPFVRDVTLDYYYYPQDFLNDDEAEKSLKRAKFGDFYQPLEKLMQNANITPPSKECIDKGECCVFSVIGVCVKPVIKLDMKKYLRLEDIAFICVAFENELESGFKILIKSPTTGDLFVEMRDCRILGENLEDEEEKKYIEVFIKAVNFIYDRLILADSKESDKTINLSLDEAVIEFAMLTQMSGEKTAEFSEKFFMSKNNPKKCAEILKQRQILWQGYEKALPSWEFLAYNFILKDTLLSFESHWELDILGLKKYIKQTTNSQIKIGKSEILEPYKIISKLEKISDYTLLNIEPEANSLEGYCFFACKKEHKERILKLSQVLGLNICEF